VWSTLRRVDGKNMRPAAMTAIDQAALNQPGERMRMKVVTFSRFPNCTIPAHAMGGQGLHNTGCGVCNDPRRVHVVNTQTQDAPVGSGIQ
jgi:hypothetical protein